MNQTMWISPSGQLLNCAPNQHYAYMNENFNQLFGKQPLNEAELHDLPYQNGWIHVQNHFGRLNVRGNALSIQRNKRVIRDIIFERLLSDRNFTVNIEYNNKAMANPYGSVYSFSMPNQYEELKQYLT